MTLAGLQPDLLRGAIQDCLHTSDKPVLAYVSPHAPEVAALLTQRGVPAFMAPESCTAALDGMLRAARWMAPSGEAASPARVSTEDFPAGPLDEAQSKQLFARFGVPGVREAVVTAPAEAERIARELGPRVVLKILSSTVTHKSDVGGVAVHLAAEQAGPRLAAMAAEVERRWLPTWANA